jgi:hypothetical protein
MSNYLTSRMIVFGLSLGRSRFHEIYSDVMALSERRYSTPMELSKRRAIATPMDGTARL